MENDMEREIFNDTIEPYEGEQIVSDMEIDQSGNESNFYELGEGSNAVFVREELRRGAFGPNKRNAENERTISRQDRIKLGELFEKAMTSRGWDFAESLLLLVDRQTLNDFLCISLDCIWFLCTHEEFYAICGVIKKIVTNGAYDFRRATLRTSYLASCVSASRSGTMNLAETVGLLAERLHETVEEYNDDDVLSADTSAKMQKFAVWAFKGIDFHSQFDKNRNRVPYDEAVAIQLQLSAFKMFLNLAGHNLTGRVFTEAFDAACFTLTLFSSSIHPCWPYGFSASAIKGLLDMLIEGGADNVTECFLEASRFGSTEVVRILLQITRNNSLDVDVNLALGFAAHYSKIETMECLVVEGKATSFMGPLLRAAEKGCLPVVQWFVKRGCKDLELCLTLIAATSFNQIDVTAYLLTQIPPHVLAPFGMEIIKATAERSNGSFEGVDLLLRLNYLGDPALTYSVADRISQLDDRSVDSEVQLFLRRHWSEGALMKGLLQGQEHFVNMVKVINRGESPLALKDLPVPLMVGIAYLPLYKECVKAGGSLVSQNLRGQLIEAVRRLGGGVLAEPTQTRELLAFLEQYIRPFLSD